MKLRLVLAALFAGSAGVWLAVGQLWAAAFCAVSCAAWLVSASTMRRPR